MRDIGRRRKRQLGSTWSCDGGGEGVDGVSGTAALESAALIGRGDYALSYSEKVVPHAQTDWDC
jgi:hypothetical protein